MKYLFLYAPKNVTINKIKGGEHYENFFKMDTIYNIYIFTFSREINDSFMENVSKVSYALKIITYKKYISGNAIIKNAI